MVQDITPLRRKATREERPATEFELGVSQNDPPHRMVNTSLSHTNDYTFTNEPEQTQSGVNDLKELCLVFLEEF